MGEIKEEVVSVLRNFVTKKELLMPVPMEEDYRSNQTRFLIEFIKKKNIKTIGVTGGSGAGKDTFVQAIEELGNEGGCLFSRDLPKVIHIRFGDVMKVMAYELGMVPFPKQHYEENREARFKPLPHVPDKNALNAWIALDVIRTYNPYVFIHKSLDNLHSYLSRLPKKNMPALLVFSGMRTEVGLRVVTSLADQMVRIVRPDQTPPEGATLDELQLLWPVDKIIENTGTINDLKEKAVKLVKEGFNYE